MMNKIFKQGLHHLYDKQKSGRREITLWLLAIAFGGLGVLTKIFSAALINGDDSYLVYHFDFINLENVLLFIFLTLIARFCLSNLESWLHNGDFFNHQKQKVRAPKYFFWLTFVICFLVFGFVFCIYYPGVTMNDTLLSAFDPYTSDQHPIFFQFIVNQIFEFVFWLSGDANLGFAVIAFIQVIVGSLIWAYLVWWFKSHKIKNVFCYLVIIFAVAFPIIANLTIGILKDTWFAYSLMLFIPTAFSLLFDQKIQKSTVILFVISALACSLVRANGKFVIIATLILFVIYFIIKKRPRKATIIWTLSLVILAQVVSTAFISIRQIPTTSSVESMSIPISQIAAVINKYDGHVPEDVISYDDQVFLSQLLPLNKWSENYRYSFVDSIKFDDDFDDEYFDANVVTFLEIWEKTFWREPALYLQAYLAQTYGFWNLAFWQTDIVDAEQSNFQTIKNNTTEEWINADSGEPYDFENEQIIFSDETEITTKNYYNSQITKSFALTSGIMIYFCLTVVGFLFIWRRSSLILILLPILMVWGTMMLTTPASTIYRYNYYLVLALPIITFTLLYGQDKVRK